MTDAMAGLDFTGAIRDIRKGMLLKPVLHNYLYDAKFPAFAMKFPKEEMERRPDDWFHPSTHPMWPEQALFNYIARPDEMPVERKQYMSTLSVTIGKAMHGFMEVCLTDAGLRPKDMNKCTTCPPSLKCKEPGVVCTDTGSRGHMDGLLDLSSLSVPNAALEFPVFEFKTGNERKMANVDDLDLATYREKWPEYYAQNQEYMRMSGRRMVIVLFMVMGWPWDMTEIHVPYDPFFAGNIRDKYLRVRQAVADQTPLLDSCCNRLKSCPSGKICTADKARATAAPRPVLRNL